MNTSVTLSMRLSSSTESTGSRLIGTGGSKSARAATGSCRAWASSHILISLRQAYGREVAGQHRTGDLPDHGIVWQKRWVVQRVRPASANEQHQRAEAAGVIGKVVGSARAERGVHAEPGLAQPRPGGDRERLIIDERGLALVDSHRAAAAVRQACVLDDLAHDASQDGPVCLVE